ncbi:MAG: hypothetical protein KKB50_11215 [Planctomycetes bacterium]|nr:hypothetical protein [Planctomycetota bacterium]
MATAHRSVLLPIWRALRSHHAAPHSRPPRFLGGDVAVVGGEATRLPLGMDGDLLKLLIEEADDVPVPADPDPLAEVVRPHRLICRTMAHWGQRLVASGRFVQLILPRWKLAAILARHKP